ncbi:MAG: Chaperone protein DnaK [Gammaproteobacteria bacterium]|nr:Chaperone protein DnaK [Gammaproteobacteria bacterium]
MNRNTIDFGIDLGTTNSSIAMLRGTDTEIIKNNENLEITPSAVWIDKKGSLYVGRAAKERLIVDSENAASEFKLRMGTTAETLFKRSARKMKPEELSAEILKSLKADVAQRTGEDIEAAVITVPAAFDLPQCKATEAAARLAGLKVSPLLQEPVAAAMAYGFQHEGKKSFWLVYDLGGGTFDAAIVQVRDGMIQVVNHGGDNQLGGKLIDWRIIEDLILPTLKREYDLPDFNRGNKRWLAAFAKLKKAAEDAKVQVSRDKSSEILIDSLCLDANGEQVQFEYELSRSDVERLAEPFVLRSINICKKVLSESRLGAQSLEKILLVGGATLMPYLKEMIEDKKDGLGIPLDFSIDQLTAVSRGAAIFAGTQRLTGVTSKPVVAGQFKIELEYEPIGPDIDPLITGKVIAADNQTLAGFTIEFVNHDSRPPWRSGKVSLDRDGVFVTNLWAEKGRRNTFQIELYDSTGRKRETAPDHLTYTIGATITEQPIIHSMGVAETNNECCRYFEKGTALPARKRVNFRTTVAVRKGQPDSQIVIPVIEGDNQRADRNRIIGRLEISGTEVNRDVPAGSEVEITIEMDQSRLVKAKAYIPILDQEFELTAFVVNQDSPQFEQLQKEAEAQNERLNQISEKAYELGNSEADRILLQIEEEQVERDIQEALTASEADANAASTCQTRLLTLKSMLDDIEDALERPSLLAEAEEWLQKTRQAVQHHGEASERRRFVSLEQETQRAIEAQDIDQLRRKIDDLKEIYYRIARRQPDFWVGWLNYLESQRERMREQHKAEQLFARADRAISENELPVLASSVRQLLDLLPEEERQEADSAFGSTVIRD